MQSLQSFVVKKGIRLGVGVLRKRKTLRKKGLEERRRIVNSAAKRWMSLPLNSKVEPLHIEGIYSEWISNNQSAADKVILYFHGGAYGYCSADTHRPLAARIMNEAGVKVLLPEYRLAPEHPFPAALQDAIIVYHWLLAQRYDSSNIIFAGDSAGAGLSLAAVHMLKSQNEPLPAAVICLSPWVDLTSSGESYLKNKWKDPYLTLELIKKMALSYAGSESLTNPLISPVFADFSGFPPLYIQAGSSELVFSDAEKLAQHARLAGVNATLKVWNGMWHVFQMSGTMPESRKATKEIGMFVKSILEGRV